MKKCFKPSLVTDLVAQQLLSSVVLAEASTLKLLMLALI
jgi:hypothetical protein